MRKISTDLSIVPRSSHGSTGRADDPLLDFELSVTDLLAEPDPSRRWARAFGNQRPLRIEIGVGNSDFLIEVALRDPGFNYLGFEYSRKRVNKFLRRVRTRGASNIRMLRVNAGWVLGELVAPASADHIYIHFPDPWPKRRHAKHRLIQPPVAELLRRILRPGGGMSLRSDDPQYAAQMLAVLDTVEGLENTTGKGHFAEAPRDSVPTRYEMKYRSEGRAIHYLEYRRI